MLAVCKYEVMRKKTESAVGLKVYCSVSFEMQTFQDRSFADAFPDGQKMHFNKNPF